MDEPAIDLDLLGEVLAPVFGGSTSVVDTSALGESTRASPWRIDIETTQGLQSCVLRYGESVSRNEATALNAMRDHPIPTPDVLLWDETGERLGTPVFVSELINGDPLLPAMVRHETWAIDLYFETALRLQSVTAEELPHGTHLEGGETIDMVIEWAFGRFEEPSDLHRTAYEQLVETRPSVPATAFSNGDLWPENILVKERQLVGVVDWQHAGWTDPIFEFLLPFFLVPELRDLGVEERFVEAKGCDPGILYWYHGVEFFDSLSIVTKLGEPYEMHTEESLTRDLERWLST